MKRVKNLIKLTKLNSESLNEKESCHVVGSGFGYCGCYYANCGKTGDGASKPGTVRQNVRPSDGQSFITLY